MKRLCVFCGSSMGHDQAYAYEAELLGKIMAMENVELIYGGGSIGLMGVLADAVMASGGSVTGVIPRFLYEKEVGHDGVRELMIVETMHERKMKMAELSEGFVAMPGGIGTLEEFFEIFTWSQLKLIKHPVALLNTNGYFDQLLQFMQHMEREGLLKKDILDMLIVEDNAEMLIRKLKQFEVVASKDSIGRT